MNRWTFLLALVTILALGLSVGEARRMVITRGSGDAFQRWLTLEVIHIHKQLNQDLGFLKSNDRVPKSELQLPQQILHNFIGKELPQRSLCDSCMDISRFMEEGLANPATANGLVEYVNGSLCMNFPGIQLECLNLAKIFVLGLVETLQNYAAPDKLCGETKLCPSFGMLLMNEARTCKLCSEFAMEILTYVQQRATETEILEALHSQCAKLGDFSLTCNLLVDTHAPIYINKLDSTTPDEVCEKIGMCTSHSMRDDSTCGTCEFAMFQIKAKLRDPHVQEKMLKTLFDQCRKIPSHVEQCKEIVARYGPSILANLDKDVNAETICTTIHACQKKKLADEILIQLPGALNGVARP